MIDRELIAQVRRIQVRTRRLVTDLLAGGYTSVFKGSGIEFDEVREFTEGDDIRSVDWNVTARTGRPFIKRFVEERELTILFLPDDSPSLLYGSQRRSPRQAAAELCACLAFAAMRSGDKVGLLFGGGGGPGKFIPARKGNSHALRVIREVLAAPAGRAGGDMGAAVDFLGRVLRRRAVVFLVSDFHFELPGLEASLKRFARRHDLVGAHLLDPRELELPRGGLMTLEDAESGRRLVVDTARADLRREWRAAGERRVGEVKAFLRRCRADRMVVSLDQPPTVPLLKLFRERERRMTG